MNAVMTRLDEIMKTLKELKSEYSIIRKEILGIGASTASTSQSLGIIENKTLREIVEEMQFQVNAINKKLMHDKKHEEIPLKLKPKNILNQSAAKESSDESVKESVMEFPVVAIKRKTILDERQWMKSKFNEMRKTKTVQDGESLRETTVGTISTSIPCSAYVRSSCTIKLSNFLDSALTDPRYHFWLSSRNSGPSSVNGHHSEVISVKGYENCCKLLCSFAINQLLRLTIHCEVVDYRVKLGIGLTPVDVPTDQTLFSTLCTMPQGPDVCMTDYLSYASKLEIFVSHGNLLVRGHIYRGPRSIVHVEIFEISNANLSSASAWGTIKRIVDGESVKTPLFTKPYEKISRVTGYYERFSCVIEIVNCLSVALKNQHRFYYNCEKHDSVPCEVLPFQREIFSAEDETKLEAMFTYEIDSTDLAFVVALKIEADHNSFAAAFVSSPADAVLKELEALMKPDQWKTHLHRKYAKAKDGVQLIQMRNIRAEMSMSEEEQSNLNIRIFAV